MIYLPNRLKSPDLPEEPWDFGKSKKDFRYWEISWVLIERYQENNSLSRVSRIWWC